MQLNPDHIRQRFQEFDFNKLFLEELSWESPRKIKINAPDGARVREIAHLGGIPALEVETGEAVPDAQGRRALYDAISKQFHENLLLFVDASRTQTVWYWVKREGSKTVVREHPFVKGQPGDLFLSKIAGLFVDLEEYDETGHISVLRVGEKLKNALDVSKVTKQFYREFKECHTHFLKCIHGIDAESDRRWYASVLLNRLMFVYFLQKKGFLDSKANNKYDYLRSKFCDDYFELFLKPLFFVGFACPNDDPKKQALRAKLGDIPYLNGGLFLQHNLEITYPKIKVEDEAFDNVLKLFGRYSWSISDVPEEPDELAVDVLGYIFEKYINDQKSAGAYYTPPEITEYLCERTIHDLLVERVSIFRNGTAKTFESVGDMLLNLDGELCRVMLSQLETLRLCDPAVGSGAFLVAALKTLTNLYGALWGRAGVLNDRQLQTQIIGDEKHHSSPFYAIRKRIIRQNLYGVDLMAEATEIARLRLFLALVASAKTLDDLEPLPNIEFNILSGNSLIGMCSIGKADFVDAQDLIGWSDFDDLRRRKERDTEIYRNLEDYPQEDRAIQKERVEGERRELHQICDNALLHEFTKTLRIFYEEAQPSGKPQKRNVEKKDIEALQPFHWGYEFSQVMQQGGFDAIITNPPWEIWKPNAKEFFEDYSSLVTKNTMTIKQFEEHQSELLQDPELATAWRSYLSGFPHVSEYFRKHSGYENQISVVNGKKAGTDINLYKLFTERCFRLLNDKGRTGIVIPSGSYTDLGAKQLREMLFGEAQVTGLFGFENRKTIFEGVDSRFKFVVLTFRKGGQTQEFPAAFMRHDVGDLAAFPTHDSLHIGVELVRRLSPDSLSIMEFKSEQDVEIAEKMLRFPLLGQKFEDTWNLSLTREFDMTNDSYLFQTAPGKGRLPLYEGKMVHQFSHELAKPKYWVEEKAGRAAILGRTKDTNQKVDYQGYRLGFRDIARNTDTRTLITTLMPPAFHGNKLPTVRVFDEQGKILVPYDVQLFLCACWNSFVLDWVLRQKVSATINFHFLYGLSVPRLTAKDPQFAPIISRAARLICTTPEFDDLAREVGLAGHADGVTESTERARLRAELDGLVAHLYGLTEAEFAHILGTFPLVAEPVKLAARNAYRDVERGLIR